jgi:hypothetical protein
MIISLLVGFGILHFGLAELDVPTNQLFSRRGVAVTGYSWKSNGQLLISGLERGKCVTYSLNPKVSSKDRTVRLSPQIQPLCQSLGWRMSPDGASSVSFEALPSSSSKYPPFVWRIVDIEHGTFRTDDRVYSSFGRGGRNWTWQGGLPRWIALLVTGKGWDFVSWSVEPGKPVQRFTLDRLPNALPQDGVSGRWDALWIECVADDSVLVFVPSADKPASISVAQYALSKAARLVSHYVVDLPDKCRIADVALSSDSTTIAWLLSSPQGGMSNADGDKREYSFWLSRVDGSEMRSMGKVMGGTRMMQSVEDLRWSPSGKSVTFRFRGAIWQAMIPISASK